MARKKHNYRSMLRNFNMNYGTDESKLDGWQRLCADCGLRSGPSITQCKRMLVSAHINIVDLLNAKSSGMFPQRHASRAALAAYTSMEEMFFPKSLAKENGFLKVLLVGVF